MKIGFIGAGNMGDAILRGYAPAAEKKGDSILAVSYTHLDVYKRQSEYGGSGGLHGGRLSGRLYAETGL